MRAPLTTALLVLACAACGPSMGGHFANRGATPTLVILPTEAAVDQRLLTTIDGALHHVTVKGIEQSVDSKVSMEVVQLSIGCVDPTPKCYAAAAKSLLANHMLFARVLPADAKKKRALRVTVVLFDGSRGGIVGEVTRTFASEDEAVRDVGRLVEAVVSSPPPPQDSTES